MLISVIAASDFGGHDLGKVQNSYWGDSDIHGRIGNEKQRTESERAFIFERGGEGCGLP